KRMGEAHGRGILRAGEVVVDVASVEREQHWFPPLPSSVIALETTSIHIAEIPPSITTSEPVMKLDSSDARKTSAQPTSSGRPSRPIGTWRPSFCCITSLPKRSRYLSRIGVSM